MYFIWVSFKFFLSFLLIRLQIYSISFICILTCNFFLVLSLVVKVSASTPCMSNLIFLLLQGIICLCLSSALRNNFRHLRQLNKWNHKAIKLTHSFAFCPKGLPRRGQCGDGDRGTLRWRQIGDWKVYVLLLLPRKSYCADLLPPFAFARNSKIVSGRCRKCVCKVVCVGVCLKCV